MNGVDVAAAGLDEASGLPIIMRRAGMIRSARGCKAAPAVRGARFPKMHPDHELAAFKVTHKKSGTSYYLRAKSASHAIEITTMKLGDAEGRSAWDAVSETPSFPLKHGALCDAAGHIVHTAVY